MLNSTKYSQLGARTPLEGLAAELHKTVNCLTAVWDFAVDGGAVSTISLNDDQGNPAILPDNAIVFAVIADNVTLPVSTGNNGTIALQSKAAGDLIATVDPDATNWTEGLPVVGVPLLSDKTTLVKMTAETRVKMVIATNAFTAGKIRFHILYLLGA